MEELTKTRNRGAWTSKSRAYLAAAQKVIEGLREYWPLTLRQVYYQLVASEYIENNIPQYKKLSRILTKARLDGLIEWGAIEDRARSTLTVGTWGGRKNFISQELRLFLTGYRRDLLQTQNRAFEIWTEKDALSRIIQGAADPYGIPVIVARGFSSISYVHECRLRIEENRERGQNTTILYFGDLDPSGWEMLPAMLETLNNEMGLSEYIEGQRRALTPEQVKAYKLPHNPEALKPKDTRAKKYIKKFGPLAVELDALPPATLEKIIKNAIEENLDKSLFKKEQIKEIEDIKRIEELREDTQVFFQELD